MTSSRAERNCNPLNIRPSRDKWLGMRAEQTDPGFVQFQTTFHGLRAGAKNLLTYYRVHKRRTVSEIISAWAPPSDNNPTAAYIDTVSKSLGVSPDQIIDLNDKIVIRRLMAAMIQVECGSQPYSVTELEAAINAAFETHQTKPAVADSPKAPGTPPLVDQPSPMPTRKIMVGGLVGACAFVVMVIWNRLFPESPLTAEYATEIASAVILAVTLVTQYFVRNRATDVPPGEDQVAAEPQPVTEPDPERAAPSL